LKRVQQVERNGGKQIEQEPASDIVERHLPGIVHNLATFTDVRRSKVEYNICATTTTTTTTHINHVIV